MNKLEKQLLKEEIMEDVREERMIIFFIALVIVSIFLLGFVNGAI